VRLLNWLFGRKESPVTTTESEKHSAPTDAGRLQVAEKHVTASTPERHVAPRPLSAPPPSAPPIAAKAPEKHAPLAERERPVQTPSKQEKQTSPPSEADNLKRWRESGQARAWVEAHKGQWGHQEWLALLEELQRSPFWPMHPDQIGIVLEDLKREWLQRN